MCYSTTCSAHVSQCHQTHTPFWIEIIINTTDKLKRQFSIFCIFTFSFNIHYQQISLLSLLCLLKHEINAHLMEFILFVTMDTKELITSDHKQCTKLLLCFNCVLCYLWWYKETHNCLVTQRFQNSLIVRNTALPCFHKCVRVFLP